MSQVSVIMPTYNRASTIERAVISVLSQTYTDFELIIIDGGSNDNTKEILANIKDERLKIVYLSEKKRISVVRNEGLKQANGEIIAYLDSDNIWHHNYLEVMTNELMPNNILVYSAQNELLVEGSSTESKVIGRMIRDHEYNPTALIYGNYIDTNATIHYKKVIEEVGLFDETLSSCEDWEFFARIVFKYPLKIKYVRQVLGDYYFYLKNTLETVTNSENSDEKIKALFKVESSEGDVKYVQDKLKSIMGLRKA